MILTKDELKSLDISFLGKPFVSFETNLETRNLDLSFLGKPFVAIWDTGTPPEPVFDKTRFFMLF